MEKLDQVIKLHKEFRQAIQTIRNAKTKRVGLSQMAISPKEKANMINKATVFYSLKITDVYANINKELLEAGKPTLVNPYERI